jgi:ClpP class serine protease
MIRQQNENIKAAHDKKHALLSKQSTKNNLEAFHKEFAQEVEATRATPLELNDEENAKKVMTVVKAVFRSFAFEYRSIKKEERRKEKEEIRKRCMGDLFNSEI